jgi:hypothetical protein
MVNIAWKAVEEYVVTEKEAEDAIDKGKTMEDFIKEEEAKDDGRTLLEKMAEAAKAW